MGLKGTSGAELTRSGVGSSAESTRETASAYTITLVEKLANGTGGVRSDRSYTTSAITIGNLAVGTEVTIRGSKYTAVGVGRTRLAKDRASHVAE